MTVERAAIQKENQVRISKACKQFPKIVLGVCVLATGAQSQASECQGTALSNGERVSMYYADSQLGVGSSMEIDTHDLGVSGFYTVNKMIRTGLGNYYLLSFDLGTRDGLMYLLADSTGRLHLFRKEEVSPSTYFPLTCE